MSIFPISVGVATLVGFLFSVLRRLQGFMVWECGNVLGGGGKVFLILLGMRWEMDLRCVFNMIYGVGSSHQRFILFYFLSRIILYCML
jgi:hypothetical protein